MTAKRDELIRLIEGMSDDQVEALLAAARRQGFAKPRTTWPPKFVGMIKDGPADGSTAVDRDGVSWPHGEPRSAVSHRGHEPR